MRPDTQPVLEVRNLRKYFPVKQSLFVRKKRQVRAVDDVSFSIGSAETLSLVGESGCGKSTVGRVILRLIEPTSGEIHLDGQAIHALDDQAMRPHRQRVQIVFQDPFSSLNPRMRIRDILAEPIRNFRLARGESEIDARVKALLDAVRLPSGAIGRYPHEFSGGQRQRIGIARALATEPRLIVCDEPVSALDVSVKAQVVNLLGDLQKERGLSLLFISHDMAIVEHLTHRVAVMYLGRIVELADRRSLFSDPLHPYTQALLAAIPIPAVGQKRNLITITGEIPSPIDPPPGCHFHTRCPHVRADCRTSAPPMVEHRPGHWVACHLHKSGAP
jgi:peptide/nickel transport system ATP-binding protein